MMVMAVSSRRRFWWLHFEDCAQTVHLTLHLLLNAQHHFHRLTLTTSVTALDLSISRIQVGHVFAILDEVQVNLIAEGQLQH